VTDATPTPAREPHKLWCARFEDAFVIVWADHGASEAVEIAIKALRVRRHEEGRIRLEPLWLGRPFTLSP
jgi:hypothetical protein